MDVLHVLHVRHVPVHVQPGRRVRAGLALAEWCPSTLRDGQTPTVRADGQQIGIWTQRQGQTTPKERSKNTQARYHHRV